VSFAMRLTKDRCNAIGNLGRVFDEHIKVVWFERMYDEVTELLEIEGVARPAKPQGRPVYSKLRKDGTWRVHKGVVQREYYGIVTRVQGGTVPRVREEPAPTQAPTPTPALIVPAPRAEVRQPSLPGKKIRINVFL
jgi:hypothetical protein